MNLYLIGHTHRHGTSIEMVLAETMPTIEEVVEKLNLNYEPDRDEEIQIIPQHIAMNLADRSMVNINFVVNSAKETVQVLTNLYRVCPNNDLTCKYREAAAVILNCNHKL